MRDKPFSQTLGRPVHIYRSAAARGIMNRLVIEHSWVGRGPKWMLGGVSGGTAWLPKSDKRHSSAFRFIETRPAGTGGKETRARCRQAVGSDDRGEKCYSGMFFYYPWQNCCLSQSIPESHAKANRTKHRQLMPVVLVDQCFIPPPNWLLIVSTLVQPQLGRSVRT